MKTQYEIDSNSSNVADIALMTLIYQTAQRPYWLFAVFFKILHCSQWKTKGLLLIHLWIRYG